MASNIDKELWLYVKKLQRDIAKLESRMYKLEMKVYGKSKAGKM